MIKPAIPILLCLLAVAGQVRAELNQPLRPETVGLVPMPKKIAIATETVTLAPPFAIGGSKETSEGCGKWLGSELHRLFSWELADSTKARTIIDFKTQDLQRGAEAYQVVIAANRVEITSATAAGAYRGIGRLLAILENQLASPQADGTVQCRQITLTDWPDFERRGMDLQMCYPGAFSAVQRMAMTRNCIDAMARLGYNLAVFEVSGCFESKKHPEISRPGYLTQDQVRELVRYAKSRGITPIPGTNVIGHLDRAPEVFVLKDSKGHKVAMDILNPDFYGVFSDLLDEYIDVFENPPYIHIGTDEASEAFDLLSTRTTQDLGDLYAQCVNNIAAHLEKKNCRTIIWHDMLFSQLPGQPACGKRTASAFTKLSKDIITDYWCYTKKDSYSGIDLLKAQGYEVWATPWNHPDGIMALAKAAYASGCKTMLGSTWDWVYKADDALVLTAEYAWNVNAEVSYLPRDVYKRYYHLKPKDESGNDVKPLVFTGSNVQTIPPLTGTLAKVLHGSQALTAQSAAKESLTDMASILKKMKEDSDARLLLINPRNSEELICLDNINSARGFEQLILYTPAFGATTGTNNWGHEWIVSKGKIVQTVQVKGNNAIPSDGYVLSVHTSGDAFAASLSDYLRKGDAINWMLCHTSRQKTSITAHPSATDRGVRLFLTSKNMVIGKRSAAAELTLTFSDNTARKIALDRDFLKQHIPCVTPGYSFWYWYPEGESSYANGIAVIEWRREGNISLQEISIHITQEGALQDLVVLGGVKW